MPDLSEQDRTVLSALAERAMVAVEARGNLTVTPDEYATLRRVDPSEWDAELTEAWKRANLPSVPPDPFGAIIPGFHGLPIVVVSEREASGASDPDEPSGLRAKTVAP